MLFFDEQSNETRQKHTDKNKEATESKLERNQGRKKERR